MTLKGMSQYYTALFAYQGFIQRALRSTYSIIRVALTRSLFMYNADKQECKTFYYIIICHETF